MANEAVNLESGVYNARRYTCSDTYGISGGALLVLIDPYTVSGSNVSTVGNAFGGIAAFSKSAGDGTTEISAWHDGIWDLTVHAGETTIVAGSLVSMSGANFIRKAIAADILNGAIVGKALETASASEVIRVAVGVI